ncbi:MAG: type II CRISPR RNA-guided endonuclease Cas9 [Wenyingzhuangia sp.]|uniref:type II CRISPR RNA-guided endonuclease Cas9 n=1 Tax=Wenyingzhuangia sp. TaxID=1964193 RepID=UPI00321BC97D
MKKILGLDLGTTSIGWALVQEAEKENETSKIIKLGVRVNPLSTEEVKDFEKGKPTTINADRTQKRGIRRNLQRYKLRRKNLIDVLTQNNIIDENSVLTEEGKNSTFETLSLRNKAPKEKIGEEEFARILLSINKKRGYKCCRKAKSEEEGKMIDGMSVAKELYENNYTPGQYTYQLLLNHKKYIPDFYESDLKNEFLQIWDFQKQFYPALLTETLFNRLENKNQIWAICKGPFDLKGISHKGSAEEKTLDKYKWRSEALTTQIDLETLAIVLQEINQDINKSNGYLGAIGDRSKKLYFHKMTVGQYLYKQLTTNKHTSIKNQVFYRQDYLDEFEKIWETQAKYNPKLTATLKKEIRDIVIFYQRRLKSKKGLINICEYEKKTIEMVKKNKIKMKVVGPRVIPKSSPIFQEYKIWQNINNLVFTPKNEKKNHLDLDVSKGTLTAIQRTNLFEELNLRGTLKISSVLKILGMKSKDWKCNFKEVEGNKTNHALYKVLQQIAKDEGHGVDWDKKSATEIKEELLILLTKTGIDPNIINFNINSEHPEKQTSYQFWHLLYSAEDDLKTNKEDEAIYGKNSVGLKKKLHLKFGVPVAYTFLFANVILQPDYGNLSCKAIKKIIPHLQKGLEYSEAVKLAGYKHTSSLTKEENLKRILKDKLEQLPKNSLRNPVVEKILNQMVNVVNQIIEHYGKPDEIRIELARELKKSAKDRKEMISYILKATKRNQEIKRTLTKAPFNIKHPSKNDIVKYRLYKELKPLGYKTLYTDKYIEPHMLFTKAIEIEHIIPKAVVYDDSFSNKTLAYSEVNLKKSKMTSYDYIDKTDHKNLEGFIQRVHDFYGKGKNEVSKSKYLNLLTSLDQLSHDFIERELKNTQYIAKKAKEILFDICREVHTTNGKITDKLRNDWDLLNVMKELNLPKYRKIGMTVIEERKNGNTVEQIIDWSKRNDHRHHAMDALVIAFTSKSLTQHINTLNAKNDQQSVKSIMINKKQEAKLKTNGLYVLPMPNFRTEAKLHLEKILISFKSKNKVVTNNINIIKIKKGTLKKVQLTPRGKLHKETIYGHSKKEIVQKEKIGSSFTLDKIHTITQPKYRAAVLKRMAEYQNDPKLAFGGKNTLRKNPIVLDDGTKMPIMVTTKSFQDLYTIRKGIGPDLKIEKVIDPKIRKLLYKRIEEHNGDRKAALSNLETEPIWLNETKGIAIKKVTMSGVSQVEALHTKKDHRGKVILDANKNTQPVDFVSTGNNHHVAIYRDPEGKLQEQIVSMFEANARVNQNEPVVNKNFNKEIGWEFLFTLKQNEMFVFPNEEFDPNEYDLLDEKNHYKISPHLFRVQKLSTKNYFFRHHLETTVELKKELKNITYKPQLGLLGIKGIVKVRTNHLGNIVQVGEY